MLCVDRHSVQFEIIQEEVKDRTHISDKETAFDSVPCGYLAEDSYISSSIRHFSLAITETYSSVRVCDMTVIWT